MPDIANHPCLHCGKPAICDGSRDCRQFCSEECAEQDRAEFDQSIKELEEHENPGLMEGWPFPRRD